MLMLTLSVVATVTFYRVKSDTQQMEYLAATKSNEIIEAIYALFYKAEALSALVIQGDGEIRDLNRIAPIIINSPAIRNILLAPKGVVRYVYPFSSNENLVGFDLFGEGDGNKEALLAKNSKRLTLGGPFLGVQGGQVLVGRLPVYLVQQGEPYFWGLVSVTLNYPEALSPVRLQELDNLGFACEIWRIDPDKNEKQVILRTKAQSLYEPLEKEFSLLNARWMISIAPLTPWYRAYSLYAMLAAALLFSALIAAVAQNYWEMRQVKASLEHMAMYDSLTGLPNRRAGFERLDEILSQSRETESRFTLGYLDLNDFKVINDTYGHHIGDYMLKETTKRLVCSLPEGQFAARIGGDEFIFLLTGIDKEGVDEVLKRLDEAMKAPFAAKLVPDLHTSLSVGLAVYPENGLTAEDLTTHADAAMYHCKSAHRVRRRSTAKDMTAMAFLVGV